MLGDHLTRRHLRSSGNPLPLELLLGFRVDSLTILALVARLLLRVDVLAMIFLNDRCRLPLCLHILVLVVIGLRGDNVRIVSAQTVGTYGRGARAYSGR